MRATLKEAWAWLEGRKATIAAIAGVALTWAQAQRWIDDSTAMALASVLTILTGVAVGDKVRRGVL